MRELELRYGCNPDQKPARVSMRDGGELPFTVLNGRPGYINLLDALNSWQLVRDLRAVSGTPAAASFKHVSPAGAALGRPICDIGRRILFVEDGLDLSPVACAYARARGSDRVSSYGDWAALSDECDESAALYLRNEVSDGIIAPGYTPKALEILKGKKKGAYNVIQMDPSYAPDPQEARDVFGVTFQQGRSSREIGPSLLENVVTKNKDLPESAKMDMLVSLITLRYTQSNSVCYVREGHAIGIGAGQQSRIHCTRLAGDKADRWALRHHPRVLDLPFRADVRRPERDNAIDAYLSDDGEELLSGSADLFTVRPDPLTKEEKREWISKVSGLTIGSDAFFPFGDNVERAHQSGARYIVQPGGSIRDDHVIATADKYGMVMAFTGLRLFHH